MLCVAFTVQSAAQSLVSTTPYHRIIVLEEFTGIHCGYCPDGHRLATQLYNKFNQEPVLINIHSGGYAVPGTGEPDFRCSFGQPIDDQAQVSGYPAGTLNRHKFFGSDTTSMGRSTWDLAAPVLMALPSPVNVGLKSSFDTLTRELRVDVEAYYTDNAPAKTNMLNVALLENDVIGIQYDYAAGTPNPEYHHMHMLRWMLTGQWGDTVTTTSTGTLVKRSYTYTVPAEFNIAHCDVAAFMAEGQQEIYTGAKVAAMGGTTLQVGTLNIDNTQAKTVSSGANADFALTSSNVLGADEMYTLELVSNAPAAWQISTTVKGAAYTGAAFAMAKNESSAIKVHVEPGATSGVGRIDVYLRSVSYPMSPVVKRSVYLMAGVENLLMSHPDALKYDSVYTRAMEVAGCSNTGNMDRNVFEIFSQENALTGLKSVFYNVSWAFPGITDVSMNALAKLMDNGTHLLVAGQDYGWDLASLDTNAHATTATRAFYTKYMHATFVADGNSANSKYTAVTSDPLFKTVPTSVITAPYGPTYFYPDQFTPQAPAKTIFTYNNFTSKVGGLRFEGTYKLVYLGVGLEQLNPAAGDMIVTQAKRWFANEISSVEFDDLLAKGASIYPNPATNTVRVVFPSSLDAATLRVIDNVGRTVYEQELEQSSGIMNIDVSALSAGSYRLCIVNLAHTEISSSTLNIVR